MSSITRSAHVAEQLQAAAEVVLGLAGIDEGGTVTVSQPYTETAPWEIQVHGVQPAQLQTLEAAADENGAHRDEDGILRWVQATIAGFEVTWFRR